MKTTFRMSFVRDLKKIKAAPILERIGRAIKAVESANTLDDVPNSKKLSGAKDTFRIQVGDFRIGVTVAGDTVDFVRCLNRRDLYRYFP